MEVSDALVRRWRAVARGEGGVPLLSSTVRVLIGHEDGGPDATSGVADDWCGLSPLGHRRAHRLVEQLEGVPIHQVLSGPALRCRQTVMPLARERGLDVEPVAALAAGADVAVIADFIADLANPHAVLCADPLTVKRLLAHLAARPAVGTEVVLAEAGPAAVLNVRSANGTPRPGRLAHL